MAVDKVDGFARDGVGKVFLFLDRLTAAHDRVVGVVVRLVARPGMVDQLLLADPASFASAWNRFASQHRGYALPWRRHEIVALVCKAEEFVETVPKRMIGRSAAQMPLADYASDVTGIL